MMETPICDFVSRYAKEATLRLHMPGHKGVPLLGPEPLDITEIVGADSLYEADGIIRESEENVSRLFGCRTFYSTEGSSLCIRAMLYLALQHAKKEGKHPLVAAGRNAHKTFIITAVLLDFDILWLCPDRNSSYLSCALDAETLDRALKEAAEKPTAVYLTSPDYLGNTVDIHALAAVCHAHGVLLLVDNAHGAYLKFLPESRHPIDLGADLCCDSAHKTLPVLTGGAYLHIANSMSSVSASEVKHALALFGSTSPSYLILQSLDLANRYLEHYPVRLAQFIPQVQTLKDALAAHGYTLCGDEPLKLTIRTKPYGYTGEELSAFLSEHGIVCEFADPDFLVMMLTPEIGENGLHKINKTLTSLPRKNALTDGAPAFHLPEQVMTVREATFSENEIIPANQSIGRILAAATVGCPPAVPIVVCGERIDENAVRLFSYYGTKTCTVVKEK